MNQPDIFDVPGTVYVDEAVWLFNRMTMCHMIADNIDALHAMAERIGIRRQWFQDKPGHPHYDICKSKRAMAVKYGAVEITSTELVKKLDELYGKNKTQTKAR